MKQIAKFWKVSYEQFKKDLISCSLKDFKEEEIKEIYNKIQLPTRATYGSAGYDFKIPMELIMDRGREYLIPTGVRCYIDDGWVLKIYPRSGLGFKRGLKLLNTTGIIDSDYYHSDNEGHIMIKIAYEYGEPLLKLEQGSGFAQGIFTEYGITTDDRPIGKRNGGFGSTGK